MGDKGNLIMSFFGYNKMLEIAVIVISMDVKGTADTTCMLEEKTAGLGTGSHLLLQSQGRSLQSQEQAESVLLAKM